MDQEVTTAAGRRVVDVDDVCEVDPSDPGPGEILAVGYALWPDTPAWDRQTLYALRVPGTATLHRWYTVAALPLSVTLAHRRAAIRYTRREVTP